MSWLRTKIVSIFRKEILGAVEPEVSENLRMHLGEKVQALSDNLRTDVHNQFSHNLAQAVAHLTADKKPNVNALWMELKELNAVKWSVKQQGYAIGSQVYEQILSSDVPAEPEARVLDSKCATQKDVESPWFRYWMNEIKSAPVPHRKLWEFAYILQNMHGLGLLKEGNRALGFGCGEEPLPSYFADKGMQVTVTDLAPEAVAGQGWAETGQHTTSVESSYHSGLVDKADFDRLVELQYVDMNAIPDTLDGLYDVCWSVCALEHLGSIEQGLSFIENSLKCLKPGGVAIHTTEFNYTETDKTIDNWPTVLFLQRHFEELRDRLEAKGHTMQALDFNVGLKPLDTFVDLPPYNQQNFLVLENPTPGDDYVVSHLKLSVDGFPSTCFALTVTKAG